MSSQFQPKYKDFQQDIERYLVSIGKCEKTKDGMTVFRGYEDALKLIFSRYLDQEAYDPLVSHFRNWNWEETYNNFLWELTDALTKRRDWPRLQKLWDGVIGKRRKLYNDIRKIENDDPGALPSKTVVQSKERLLETLERVKSFSEDLGNLADTEKYAKMIGKIERGRKA